MGIGDWPNPKSPIPNPQSPIPNPYFFNYILIYLFYNHIKFFYVIINYIKNNEFSLEL